MRRQDLCYSPGTETSETEFTLLMLNDDDARYPAELPFDRTNARQRNVNRLQADMHGDVYTVGHESEFLRRCRNSAANPQAAVFSAMTARHAMPSISFEGGVGQERISELLDMKG
jgi:hypothetical protein